MADPVTIMAGAGLALTALGAITSASGAEYKGQAEAGQHNYQAGVARLNAQLAEQNAAYSREAGEVTAQKSGMKTAFEVGSIKASQGAKGLNVMSGTNVDVRESQTEVGEQDQAVIRANAARRAWGYEIEGTKEKGQAGMLDAAAQNSKTAGGISAFGSILGGAGSVASKWFQYKSDFGNSESNPTSPGPYEAPVSNV